MAIVVKKVIQPTPEDVKKFYESLQTEVPTDIMDTFSGQKFNKNLLEQYLQQFPEKAEIIRSWFQGFNIVEDSPTVKLYNAGWHGLAVGAGLAISMGIFPLPISIMMNANIHHHPAMRFLMGGLGITLWPFVLIYAFIFMRGRPYFGLFPLFRGAELPPNPTYWYEWPVWIFVNLGSIIGIAMSPFSQGTTKEDEIAYREFLSKHMGFLDRGSEGTVPEDLYEKAKELAVLKDPMEWSHGVTTLENALMNQSSPVPSEGAQGQ
jgi:hypothetical protein